MSISDAIKRMHETDLRMRRAFSFLNIIGTLVIAGFALIVIGYIRSADKSGSE